MTNYSKLYWLTRLDYFTTYFQVAAFLLIAISAIMLLVAFVIRDKEFCNEKECLEIDTFRKKTKGSVRWLVAIGVVLITIRVFIPSRNEIIFIMAGGKTMDYIQSDSSLQKIPYQATKLVSDYMEKSINEIKTKP
jgi:hypothetical protein